MTKKEPTLEEMAEQISDLQTQLSDMKKAYNEKSMLPIILQKKHTLQKQKLYMEIGTFLCRERTLSGGSCYTLLNSIR